VRSVVANVLNRAVVLVSAKYVYMYDKFKKNIGVKSALCLVVC